MNILGSLKKSSIARPAVNRLARSASQRSVARVAPRLMESNLPAAQAYGRALTALHSPLGVKEAALVEKIEHLRKQLEASSTKVQGTDHGAGTQYSEDDAAKTVGEVTAQTSKPPRWALFLFHLVRCTEAQQALELGTSMGISAAYQASALQLAGAGHLTSIEGSPPSADLARQHLTTLGLLPAFVNVLTGRFADVLPSLLDETPDLDYLFIDGHHDEAATLAYFADCKPHLTPGATVIFDDIRWSAGMLSAWQQIVSDPDVAVSLDCSSVGIVSVDPGAGDRLSASVRVG